MQFGGALHVSSSWHSVETLASGLGAPFALLPSGLQVRTRGEGTTGDHNVLRWSLGAPAAPVKNPMEPDIVLAVSLDGDIGIFLRSFPGDEKNTSRGQLRALRMSATMDQVLDQREVIKISTKAVNYVASVAFANENDEMVYSYGLSSAVSGRYMAVSSFYSTHVLDLSTGTFLPLDQTCTSGRFSATYYAGVNALALSPDDSTLYLARFENDAANMKILSLDLATGRCGRPGWPTEPVFRSVRALSMSREGLIIYVAEKVVVPGSDDDLHQVKHT